MTNLPRKTCVLATAVLGVLAIAGAHAAQPADVAAKKELRRQAFLQGKAASKVLPQKQPRNEREAMATRRVTPSGIVELKLPEDRMLELTAIRRADGSIDVGHHALDGGRDQEASHD
jgi:hypothetical protein